MEINKNEFQHILKLDQKELKAYLVNVLKENGYSDIVNEDGFIYAKGSENYLLAAHMDRHPNLKEKVITIDESVNQKNEEIWISPEGIAGDDRCGVYIILELIKIYKPSVLFTEDEEIGCVGSKKFIDTKYIEDLKCLNYFIQIDRGHTHRNIVDKHNKHGRDVVFYEVNNKLFIENVCKYTGYGIGKGTCTDIVYLSKATDVASFNISAGYYDEHSLKEYIKPKEVINCYDAVVKVIQNMKEKYEAFNAEK